MCCREEAGRAFPDEEITVHKQYCLLYKTHHLTMCKR